MCAPRNVAPFITPQLSPPLWGWFMSWGLLDWLHKPGVLGSTPSDCWPFHFPLFCLLTSKNLFYSKHNARIWALRVRKTLSMGSLLMERVFQSTSMEFWQHILSGCQVHVQWLRHFSTTCVVYIEDCEGWWLSGCRSSVVDSLVVFFFLMNGLGMRLSGRALATQARCPGFWFPAIASLFNFLPFCLGVGFLHSKLLELGLFVSVYTLHSDFSSSTVFYVIRLCIY